ncbi:MAG TPA: ABC transporter ATP-binding protein [Clostridiales bacterium]|nr:ABC transporter ATP-binding protein [Clostridiales bacterium]
MVLLHNGNTAGKKDSIFKRFSRNRGTALRLLSYLGDYKLKVAAVAACIIINAAAGVIGAMFMQTVIDDFVEPMLVSGSRDFSGLAFAILRQALIYAIGIFCIFMYNRITCTITQAILRDIRNNMFDHMQTLPVRYFDTNSYGDVMSKYTNDTDALRMMISRGIPQVFSSLITVVSTFTAMCITSIPLTLFTLLTLSVMLWVSKEIAKNSRKYFVSQQKAIGDLDGYVEEMINGQKVVKIFNHEKKAQEGFDKLNEELNLNVSKANTFANILGPANNNLSHLQYTLLAVFGGFLAINGIGGMTLGGIAAFLGLSRSFSMPIGQLSQQMNSIIVALAAGERIFKLIDEPSENDDGYVTLVNAEIDPDGEIKESSRRTGRWAWRHPHKADGSVSFKELRGDVRLLDVDFAYEPGKPVLHDINIYAEPGQKIAFVGATGAGKTTVTNLLNRFYDIDDGKIRYDGININKIKKSDLRRSLGMVLQDVNLFTGTVLENIRYGKLDATDEECIDAAKRANADGFIRMLPEGYNTVLEGDGSGLSQGQRQLISIARAAVADPPVMILDEATSSIDTSTEAVVQKGMDALMHGRTVFVIAHRLSTVRNADVIMVFENGRIIERGSHDKLISEQGKYWQLYTGVFELE